jgi:hypothetical protein
VNNEKQGWYAMPTPNSFSVPNINPTPRPKRHLYGPDYPPPKIGRKKGVPNRVTADLKRGVVDAAIALGCDGNGTNGLQGFLMHLGWHHPKAFCGLLAKLLPLQISGDLQHSGGVATVNVISVPAGNYLTQEDVARLSAPGLQLERAPQQAEETPAETTDKRLQRAGVVRVV